MRLLTLFLVPAALLASQPRFARLGEFQGQVEVQLTAADPWMPAERNLPLSESAWLRTGAGGRVEIEMDDGSAWRLGPNSLGEISDYTRLSTGQRITLLSLDHGTAYYTGQPVGRDVTMLVLPGAQLTVLQGSRVRQTAQPGWSQAAVLEGLVRFSSPAAEMDIREGTTARVDPANAARFSLEPQISLEPLDQWSEGRDKMFAHPASAAYVNAAYGLADLDSAGQWTPSEKLGMVWKPEVPDGWAPYRNGRWQYYESLGYTWVSGESWGWMPYHNGRWAREANLGWVWQPAPSAVFHPGDVYWLRGANFTGWGPLAPGEDWSAPNPGVVTPQGYTAGITTYASFRPDVRAVDGAGFTPPTAEQMKTAFFVPALPSPAFLPARLDALRPMLQVGGTRVMPSVPDVTFGDSNAAPPSDLMTNPPSDPPPPPPVSDVGIAPPPDGVYPVPPAAIPSYDPQIPIYPPDHPSYSPRRQGGGGYPDAGNPGGGAPGAGRGSSGGGNAGSSGAPGAGRGTGGIGNPANSGASGGGRASGGGNQPGQPNSSPSPGGTRPTQSGNPPAPSPTTSNQPTSTATSSKPSHPSTPPPAGTPAPTPVNRPEPGRPSPVSPPKVTPPAPPAKDDTVVKKIASTSGNEQELYRQILQDIDPKQPNFTKALSDLDAWSHKFPNSTYSNDRLYYYIHVYNSMSKPEQVLDTAAPVVRAGVRSSYRDQQQVLQVLVAASANVTKLRNPTSEQLDTGQRAAHELLEFLPDYFAPRRKPANVSDSAWSIGREQLQQYAERALTHRPAARIVAAN